MTAEQVFRGRRVRSARPLPDGFMVGLVVDLAAYFQRVERPFVWQAELVKPSSGLFPPDLAPAARTLRLQRLLEHPVEVDGVVFAIERGQKRGMYQKTVRVVAQVGCLEDLSPRTPIRQNWRDDAKPDLGDYVPSWKMTRTADRDGVVDYSSLGSGHPRVSPSDGNADFHATVYERLDDLEEMVAAHEEACQKFEEWFKDPRLTRTRAPVVKELFERLLMLVLNIEAVARRVGPEAVAALRPIATPLDGGEVSEMRDAEGVVEQDGY